MVSPRKLWDRPELARGVLVDRAERLRTVYGGALGVQIAEAVEMHLACTRGQVPRRDELRHTLQSFLRAPESAPAGWFESVEAELLPVAVRRFGVPRLEGLGLNQLVACAREALQTIPVKRSGRARHKQADKRLLRRLLELVPDWSRAEQDGLMLRALLACGVTSAADPRGYQAAEYLRDARAMTLDEAHKT